MFVGVCVIVLRCCVVVSVRCVAVFVLWVCAVDCVVLWLVVFGLVSVLCGGLLWSVLCWFDRVRMFRVGCIVVRCVDVAWFDVPFALLFFVSL